MAAETVNAEQDPSMAQQRGEALLALVTAPDEPTQTEVRQGVSRQAVSSADRYTVHVELNPGGEPAQLRTGHVLAQAAAERLTCDATLVGHTLNAEGEPTDISRKTRIVSGPLRRALLRRDKGCRFPGCSQSRFVDAHHVHHWAQGGETKLSNLVLLCSRHHRWVHEGTYRIHAHHPQRGATQFRFYTAQGVQLLPTGDHGLTQVESLPHVPAGTCGPAEKPIDDGVHDSRLRPKSPQARPDYYEIACYLARYAPRE